MKTTSRLLGCVAIASVIGIAPSAFAKGGGVTSTAVRPNTTQVFQPAIDPLGPNPSTSSAMAVGGNGHVFRVIPPPVSPTDGPVASSASAVAGNGHVFRVIPPPFGPTSATASPLVNTSIERPLMSTTRPNLGVSDGVSTTQRLHSTTGGLDLNRGMSTVQAVRSASGGTSSTQFLHSTSTTQALRSSTGAVNPDQDATLVTPATP